MTKFQNCICLSQLTPDRNVENNSFFRSIMISENKAIRDYCRLVLRNRPSKEDFNCGECGIKISPFNKRDGSLKTSHLINHACIHLAKSIFDCSHCENCYKTQPGIKAHLKRTHGLRNEPEHYIDLSATYHDDLIKLLQRCYGQPPPVVAIPQSRSFKQVQSFK